jgi:hypothetical protein
VEGGAVLLDEMRRQRGLAIRRGGASRAVRSQAEPGNECGRSVVTSTGWAYRPNSFRMFAAVSESVCESDCGL